MTPADVVASLNFHRGAKSHSSAKSYLTSISEILIDGPSAITLRLNSPNADIPFILSDNRLPIMPGDSNGAVDISGMGTGGYILEKFDPGVRLTAKRNPNYWKAGRAHFDAVEIDAINDGAARASALRSGAIDIMNKCDTKTVALLARDPSLRVLEQPTAQYCSSPMVVAMAPFTSPDVRTAMKYAINRQAIVDATLNGHGTVGNDQPIGPTYKYYAKDIPQREYDPDKATFYLKRAGQSGLRVALHTATLDFPGSNDAAVLMKEHARRAGIDIDVIEEPNDGYYVNVWKKVPWCMSASLGRPVESLMFATAYATGANSNETLWSNYRFMSLFKQALATLDDAKRRELYREMQMIIRDDDGEIVYAFQHSLDGHSVKIAHPDVVSNIGELDGFRVAERWWFA
jgi:peptide/nickel transport system substrate-binding protein